MANWIAITGLTAESKTVYPITFTTAESTVTSGKFKVIAEYDSSRTDMTRTVVRFRIEHIGAAQPTTDGLYLLYNANGSPDTGFNGGRRLFLIKEKTTDAKAGQGWLSVARDLGTGKTEFEISKSQGIPTFTIQDVYICNTGQGTVTYTFDADGKIKSDKVSYNSYNGTFYQLFHSEGKRKSYATRKASVYEYWGVPGTTESVCSVTDNGDNSVTFSWTVFCGEHDGISDHTLKLKYGTDLKNWMYEFPVNREDIPEAGHYKTWEMTGPVIISDPSKATQTYYATVEGSSTYYGNIGSSASATVKHYVAPYPVDSVAVGDFAIKVKKRESVAWNTPRGKNSHSTLKGFRIRVYKNGTAIAGVHQVIIDGKEYLEANTEYNLLNYCDIAYLGTYDDSRFFYPEALGFSPGDMLTFGIQAYSQDSLGRKLFADETKNQEVLIKSAGVVQVKVGSTWKEGQVYVRVNGVWKEAESVYTRASGTWKESQ